MVCFFFGDIFGVLPAADEHFISFGNISDRNPRYLLYIGDYTTLGGGFKYLLFSPRNWGRFPF